MKAIKYIIIIISALTFFASCKNNVALTEKNGKYYLNGKIFSGTAVEYYTNGNRAYEGKIVNGLREGKWDWYYENGVTRLEENYSNGKLTGKKIAWDESGKIVFEGEVQ
jgi:antitoxin component YwqK of YwqJK toxin-antitoxin module